MNPVPPLINTRIAASSWRADYSRGSPPARRGLRVGGLSHEDWWARWQAVRRLLDLDARREWVFQLVNVGDDQDQLEVVLDGVDRRHQPLAALGVLGAEAFVDDQRLQPGAGAARQQLGQGDADGELTRKARRRGS
jgi:hypothetical protein